MLIGFILGILIYSLTITLICMFGFQNTDIGTCIITGPIGWIILLIAYIIGRCLSIYRRIKRKYSKPIPREVPNIIQKLDIEEKLENGYISQKEATELLEKLRKI